MKDDRRHLAPATRDTATGRVKMEDVKRKVIQCFYVFSYIHFLADRNTARSMIGSWYVTVVCLSVCLSVTLLIVALRVGRHLRLLQYA